MSIPEFVQWDCTPEKLADGLFPLTQDTPERGRQIEAFERIDALMAIGEGTAEQQGGRRHRRDARKKPPHMRRGPPGPFDFNRAARW